jgi:predicted P-loop ATPase
LTYTPENWRSGAPLPKGWDVADAVADGWQKADIEAFMRAVVAAWSPNTPTAATSPRPTSARPVSALKPVAQEKLATVTNIQTRITTKASDAWQGDLVMNEEGRIKPSVQKNWALFLENHPEMRDVFGFDAFKMQIVLCRRPPWEQASSWENRVLKDSDYINAAMWLEAKYMTPKPSSIAPVVASVAEKNSFDRLREYLDGLEWDGTSRVATWMTDLLGVEAGRYSEIIGKRFLISAVARGMQPGVKVDTMPIIEGPQGLQKSTALRVLFGAEFFTDELSDIGSKDALMELQGVWGMEVAEMHRFNASETNAVKKFLSRQTDRYRPPYGRTVIEVPRRVVIAGTINPEGNPYLKDPTGARRFWPVAATRIDIDGLARARDQLWAEAKSLWLAGTPHWVQADEIVTVEGEQSRRTDVDVWSQKIARIVKGLDAVSLPDVLQGLEIPVKDQDVRHSARVGRVMKNLGWAVERGPDGGHIVYVMPGRAPELFEGESW